MQSLWCQVYAFNPALSSAADYSGSHTSFDISPESLYPLHYWGCCIYYCINLAQTQVHRAARFEKNITSGIQGANRRYDRKTLGVLSPIFWGPASCFLIFLEVHNYFVSSLLAHAFFSFHHSAKNNPHAFLPHSETPFCKSIVAEDSLSKGCRGFDVSTFVVHITTNKDVAIVISEICILEVNCWNHRQRKSPLQAMIQYWYNHLWDYHTHCWLHRENTQVNDHHLRGFFLFPTSG